MSIVIVGGNDCMVCRYREICKKYGHRAKVFTQMPACLKKQIGQPDLLILFTNTVSHKMVSGALTEAKRCNVPVARAHSSSVAALKSILDTHCGKGA